MSAPASATRMAPSPSQKKAQKKERTPKVFYTKKSVTASEAYAHVPKGFRMARPGEAH